MLSPILTMKPISLLLAGGLFIMTSCAYNKTPEPIPVTPDECAQITFSKNIKPIIEQNCAVSGCHATNGIGNDYGNFETYEGLKIKVDQGQVRNRVFVVKDMPPAPYGPLTTEESRALECWLNNGAPNN
jgi:uncharacterized membrane protein